MAGGNDVLRMLRPNGGWAITGNSYEGITFLECEPLTKEEFEAGFLVADAWLQEQEQQAKAQKQAILNRLGLTEEELRIVLG